MSELESCAHALTADYGDIADNAGLARAAIEHIQELTPLRGGLLAEAL